MTRELWQAEAWRQRAALRCGRKFERYLKSDQRDCVVCRGGRRHDPRHSCGRRARHEVVGGMSRRRVTRARISVQHT